MGSRSIRIYRNVFPSLFFFIILLLCLTLSPTPSFGANLFVAPSGSDSHNPTENLPWQTIGKAADNAMAGDTVIVKAGTYAEQVVPKNSGTATNYITYTAAAAESVIIDGSSISLPAYQSGLFVVEGRQYIKINGFTIRYAGPNQNSNGIVASNLVYDISSYNNPSYGAQ